MKQKRWIGIVAGFGWILFPCWGAGETTNSTLPLTQDGQPVATIVLADTPTRSAQFAAAELQCHIRKITGATLPIVSNETAVVGTRILVGASKATESLGLNTGTFQSQEYLIGFRTNALILMGKDKPDTSPANYDNPRSFPDLFDEQGTCYAVYDFLERCCDVRWYLPTDLGLVCPSNRTLQVTGVDIRRSPAMKWRCQSIGYQIPQDLCGDTIRGSTPIPALAEREQALWWRRHRIGGEPYAGTHSLERYYDRFLLTNNPAVFEVEHREYFAQGYPGKPEQMCYSNPGLISQVVRDANDFFEGKGVKTGTQAAGDYFAVVPMDNGSWCKCPDCAGKVPPTSVRAKDMFSNDIASDYLFHFVNQIARQVYKTYADKYISALAYADYAYPPSREQLAPNVSIQLCLQARQVYSKPVQDNDRKILDLWVNESKERRKFLWLYYCFPSLGATQQKFRCFPGFFAHHVVRQMATWHQAGIRGIYYEPSYVVDEQRGMLLDQLEFYVTWKLADDPTLDGNQLIEEFFTRYYGAAAQPLKTFYNRVEEIYCEPTNYPAGAVHQTEKIAWGYLGTDERMKELGQYMEQARAAASTAIEKQRVALFDQGIWQYMWAGYTNHMEWEKQKKLTMQNGTAPKMAGVSPTGDLSGVAWSAAGVMTNWLALNGEGTSRHVEARIVHDG